MNFPFEMTINALEAALILDFLARYFGYRVKTRMKYWGTGLIWCISFASISFFSWTHLYESYASSIQILINIVFCCWLLRGSVLHKIFLSAFTMGLVAIISTFTLLLLGQVSDNHVTYLLNTFSGIRIICIFVSKLIFFVITRIILRLKENGRLRLNDFLPLFIVPTLSIIAITLMMYAAIREPRIQDYAFYAVCSVLILNILTYFLFIRVSRANKMEMEMALLNLQNECMQANSREIESMYESVRALRHDLKNHLLSISARAGENDIAGIQKYTDRLLQMQVKNDKVIMFSGNPVLDAIINSKFTAAERMGIRFHTIITASLDDIAPEDVAVLIGNALDNAIQAAAGSEEKMIHLHIQPQGAYTSVEISNSIGQPVLEGNPALYTTKADRLRHGFGVKNMRKVVEKYQGMMQFYEEGGRFVCDILLLSMQSENEN